jgi:hypothetical protein
MPGDRSMARTEKPPAACVHEAELRAKTGDWAGLTNLAAVVTVIAARILVVDADERGAELLPSDLRVVDARELAFKKCSGQRAVLLSTDLDVAGVAQPVLLRGGDADDGEDEANADDDRRDEAQNSLRLHGGPGSVQRRWSPARPAAVRRPQPNASGGASTSGEQSGAHSAPSRRGRRASGHVAAAATYVHCGSWGLMACAESRSDTSMQALGISPDNYPMGTLCEEIRMKHSRGTWPSRRSFEGQKDTRKVVLIQNAMGSSSPTNACHFHCEAFSATANRAPRRTQPTHGRRVTIQTAALDPCRVAAVRASARPEIRMPNRLASGDEIVEMLARAGVPCHFWRRTLSHHHAAWPEAVTCDLRLLVSHARGVRSRPETAASLARPACPSRTYGAGVLASGCGTSPARDRRRTSRGRGTRGLERVHARGVAACVLAARLRGVRAQDKQLLDPLCVVDGFDQAGARERTRTTLALRNDVRVPQGLTCEMRDICFDKATRRWKWFTSTRRAAAA